MATLERELSASHTSLSNPSQRLETSRRLDRKSTLGDEPGKFAASPHRSSAPELLTQPDVKAGPSYGKSIDAFGADIFAGISLPRRHSESQDWLPFQLRPLQSPVIFEGQEISRARPILPKIDTIYRGIDPQGIAHSQNFGRPIRPLPPRDLTATDLADRLSQANVSIAPVSVETRGRSTVKGSQATVVQRSKP